VLHPDRALLLIIVQRSSRALTGVIALYRRSWARAVLYGKELRDKPRTWLRPLPWFCGLHHPLLCVVALASVVCSAPAESRTSPRLSFRLVHQFAIIVPVFVNESGPYDFLLDTGANSSTVDLELGQKLGLELKAGETVRTLVRQKPVGWAVARTITVGPITATHLPLLVRDLVGVHKLDPAIRGVLGQDTLNGADYLIDYGHRRLEFDGDGDLLRSLAGRHTPFTRLSTPGNSAAGALVIRAAVVDGSPRIRNLLLDSGTASLVLFAESAAGSSASFGGLLQDDEGEQQPTELRHVQLQIADREWDLFANSLVFYESKLEINGLVPTSIFLRLYISNSGGFVILSPKVRGRSFLIGVLSTIGGGSGS